MHEDGVRVRPLSYCDASGTTNGASGIELLSTIHSVSCSPDGTASAQSNHLTATSC